MNKTLEKIQLSLICIILLLFPLPQNAKCDWQSYYFSEGDFSLYMPQQPTRKTTKQKVSSEEFVESYHYQSCLSDCVIAYAVTYSDFGEGSAIDRNPNEALDVAKTYALRNVNGQLTYEGYIEYQGFQGKEYKINVETNQGLYVLIQRVFIVNGQVYQMCVTTPANNQFMPEHYQFLDSFKLGK